MDLDALLQTAAAESEKRKQAELQGLKEAEARFALEDAWIQLDANLKENSATPAIAPFLSALSACPAAKQRLRDLQTAAHADYEQSLDTAAGLTDAAAGAILVDDTPSFLRIARLRTTDSWYALRQIGKAVWGEQPKQHQPLRVSTWQEARDVMEQMVERGLSKTSNRDLAEQLICSEGLIRKAIKNSGKLQDWTDKRDQECPPIDGKKIQALTDRTLENLAEAKQADLPEDEVEHALQAITEAARKEGSMDKVKKYLAMDGASRQNLARTYIDSVKDRGSGDRVPGQV